MVIDLPMLKLRPYQEVIWDKLSKDDIKRAFILMHRRAGKDIFCIQWLFAKAITTPGNYWYLLPQQNQVRRAIWEGITSDGVKYLSLIPEEVIEKKSEQEMKIHLKNGSIISFLGGDRYDTLVGAGIKGCVVSEYALQHPNLYDLVIEPMLRESKGWCLFNTTPRGHNHAEDMYNFLTKEMNEGRKAFTCKYTVDDTGGIVTEEDLNEERRRGKPEELIQQEYYCFKPDTTVTTQRGQVKICDVQTSDFVLTHANRMRKVLGVISHYHKGDMIRIKTYGNGKDIVCTPNHPIRVHNKNSQKYEWKRADEITVQDRITYPRRQSGKREISEEFARLIAWFIAEGSLSKNAVQFTLNSNEGKYHKEIMDCAFEMGYEVHKKIYNNTCQIYIYSTELADKLSVLCGSGALYKHIPFEVIKGWEQEVYDCLINGDGCITSEDKWSYSTVSESLAYDMQQLAIMLGLKASITKSKGNCLIQGREVNAHDRYNIQISRYDRYALVNHNAVAKYCMHSEIRSITREYYEGEVYNLSVQYDESYVADGRVVHNCSFAGAIYGAYYADMLDRHCPMGDYPYDPRFPVHTMWDLGVSDSMAIWWVQFIEGTIHVIDYYENHTYGLGHYAQVVQEKGYRYAGHHLPHDGTHRQLTVDEKATSIENQLMRLGLENVDIIPRTANVYGDIQAVRGLLPLCRFDNKCVTGYNCLRDYRREYDDKNRCFKDTPLHDYTSHGADAFRILPYIHNKATKNTNYKARVAYGGGW